MLQLRPYQVKAIADLREAWRNHQRILLVMPTGSGKSLTFSQICAATIANGKTVLCLSDRTEIFEQNIRAVAGHNIPVCRIDADSKHIPNAAKLFFGMVETFKRRMPNYAHIKFDLIIVDEAHKNAYNKVFDAYPNTRVLGCTATPVSKTLHKHYTHMVQFIDIPELIEQGYLAPCKGFEMQDDFSDLDTDSTGEFTDATNFIHFNKSKLYDGVIEEWQKRAAGKKTIIFCVNIEHANNTAAAFNSIGIKAYAVSANTPTNERNWIMNQYNAGAFPILVNANIFVAGFDGPSIECVVFNRATGSLPFWLQGCGRGSRPLPGKPFFLVLDFGGNFTRHGLWDEPRQWSLEPPNKRRKTLGAAPIKSCPNCEAILPLMARICPHCNNIFLPTEKELAAGRMVELTNKIREGIEGKYISQLTIPELIELERTKQLTSKFVWRVLRGRGGPGLSQYAEIKKYKDKWLMLQYEAAEAEKLADQEIIRQGGKISKADWKINEVPKMELQ